MKPPFARDFPGVPAKRADPTAIARLQALCSTMRGSVVTEVVPTRIAAIDGVLPGGGLGCGMVHEWIGVPTTTEGGERSTGSIRSARWSPPLTVLIEMAWSTVASARDGRDRIVWIGQAIWPYPAALVSGRDQGSSVGLDRCLFVRASKPADRLWTADLALRSRAAAAVVADGSGFDLAATRRLQLAAEAGGGVCLLARPPWERPELSAAATRWLVSCSPSRTMKRRWTVELLRCKGMQPASHTRVWTLEHDDATRALRVAADVLDRPGEAQTGPIGVRRIG